MTDTVSERITAILGEEILPDNWTFGPAHIPPGFTNDFRFCAIRSGRTFHAARCFHMSWKTGPKVWQAATKDFGYLYGPVDPNMVVEDVEGATYAHWNGTVWLFAHCSPQEQSDFAANAEAYTRAQLGLDIDEANAALSVATAGTARTAAKAKVDALVEFAKAAGRRAHALVIAQTLGHYHRNPHDDHLREIAAESIGAQQLDWIARASRDDDSIRVQAAVNAVKTRLASSHTIEWRHVREKRLNDAAAARGEDPVAGYEYCYVLSQTAAVITGDSNLPDPTWPFDRLRTGTVGRGLFVYSDAEPKTNSLLAWVRRFKRPIPEGTQPGADIGSVSWTQEAAYQPS